MIPQQLNHKLIDIHNDLLDIMKNTTINRFNSIQFIQHSPNIFCTNMIEKYISTQFEIKYNNAIIFDFSVSTNILISNIESKHKIFNFMIRNEDLIYTNKFIDKIEILILSIITNHNIIRSLFNIVKPNISADKIYFDKNIYVFISYNYFELYFDTNKKIIYCDLNLIKNDDILLPFRKITLFDIFNKVFCLFS